MEVKLIVRYQYDHLMIYVLQCSFRISYALLHVANDTIGLSAAAVVGWLSLTEDLQGTVMHGR